MSDGYSCDGKWIWFSSGACQTLQLTWAAIAEKFTDDPAMQELAVELNRVSQCASGVIGQGIDADTLTPFFRRQEIKVAWLLVMKVLIHDLANHGPISSKAMEIDWDDTLRESWLKRLRILEKCLEKQVGD